MGVALITMIIIACVTGIWKWMDTTAVSNLVIRPFYKDEYNSDEVKYGNNIADKNALITVNHIMPEHAEQVIERYLETEKESQQLKAEYEEKYGKQ